MKRFLPFLLFAALPAFAEPLNRVTYLADEPPGEGGTITILNVTTNMAGPYSFNEDGNVVTAFTIETPQGLIGMVETVVPNGRCSVPCPDLYEVGSLPDGFIAIPFSISAPERGTVTIRVEPYIGF